MEFKKYQHIERYGKTAVRDIERGGCYIFPKLDGTNSSVWLAHNGELRAGSRNRELTKENDNAGFLNAIVEDERIMGYLLKHPTHRLFGEWLVPHSLKTYEEEAWRKFYIFDVCVEGGETDLGLKYIPYNDYEPLLREFDLDYIAPLGVVNNGSEESFINYMSKNNFLITDGIGEGIVIKNYNFRNKYGHQIWAKMINSEFKEKRCGKVKTPVVESQAIEQCIVDEFATSAFIEKEYSKILNNNDGIWNHNNTPELLSRIYYSLITEEIWNILKKFKNPCIKFRDLKILVIKKIKKVKPELFR